MLQEPPDPRQTPETWQAWTKLSIPPKHHSFMQTAHPRLNQPHPSPPRLRNPRPKKRKKDIYGPAMAEARQKVIDEYVGEGWEAIYPDGSSEVHPEAAMVGGFGVYFGDHRDTAQCIPITEKQTNNRGELLAAIHAIRHRTPHKRTLICSDSKLVVMGATGKASKWRRHDWQGSRGPVGPVDLWEQLLREIEQAGAAVRRLHVPSHVGIVGNTHADTLADMGRRKSPLLRGYVTSARRPRQEDQAHEQEDESDLDEPPMFSPEERAANPPPRGTPPPTPRRQGVTPLLEVEDCTSASKRPCHSPDCTDPSSGWRSRAVSRSPRATPMRDIRQELFPSSAPPPLPRQL